MATGNVPITAGSGTPIRVVTNAGVDSGANQQVFTPADQNGSFFPQDPDGTPQIAADSKALYFDAFDAGTVTAYTVAAANSGTTPAASGGQLTLAAGTVASGMSYVRTNLTFALRPQAYLRMGAFVQLEAAAQTNNTRWWGYGQNQTTPSAAAPVLNGAVFMVDYSAGTLMAAVYSAGTRTQSVNLTKPTDGAFHKYEVWFRQSIVYFLIDGVQVASITLPNTAITSGMYLIAGSVNFTTAPSAAATMKLSSLSMADTSGTVNTLGDGVNPTTQVTVKVGSTAVAAADQPLAVGLHPSSPLPAGGNTIGTVNLPTGTPLLVTSAASTNATAVKTSAANLHELAIWNPTTSAAFLKFYNKASAPTVGTDVPVYVISIPAGSSSAPAVVEKAFPPIGKRFSTGLAIAITGAAADSDTTATVAGIRISGTYV